MPIVSGIRNQEHPFIGRERERRLVLSSLQGDSRLITLSGPSGIGKTRLAIQLADDWSGSGAEAGEVRFCSLVGCQGAADLEAAVAHALGMPQHHGTDLARAIANRGQMLLILDNANQLAPLVAELVEPWLERCVELQILATSIVPLGLEGEIIVALGPLEAGDGVALYLERAHRVWANRTLAPDDEAAVGELVRRLDGVPLAIEFAAARVRLLPPRALLSKMDDRFQLFGNTPSRSGRTLAGALELTWDLLTEAERDALATASVFEAGFSFEAAKAVLGDTDDAASILDSLRAKALLSLDEGQIPSRLHLYESVQIYARDELRRRGRWEEGIRRHAAYYLEEGERRVAEPVGRGYLEAVRWLRAERANLLSIHRRFLRDEPSLAARAGLILALLISRERSLPSEVHPGESTLDAARRSGEPKELHKALRLRAAILTLEVRLPEAQALLEEALELAPTCVAPRQEAEALTQLGMLKVKRGEGEAALPLLNRAIEISRKEGLPLLEAEALLALGQEALERMSIAEAEGFFMRSLDLFRRCGHARDQGRVLFALCWVWAIRGEFSKATQGLEEVLAVARATEDRFLEGEALSNLGAIVAAAGSLNAGEAYGLQALEKHRELGDRANEAVSTTNLGIFSLLRGKLDQAETRFGQAEMLFHEGAFKSKRAQLLIYVAALEAKRGQLPEARRTLAEARAFFHASNNRLRLLEVGLVEGLLGIVEARELAAKDFNAAFALVELARSRLASFGADLESPSRSFSTVSKLLEKELASWDAGDEEVSGAAAPPQLVVGSDASWFEWAGRSRVSLQSRRTIRRIFAALVELRQRAPGEAIDPHELFERGWPGVTIHPDAAMKRMYFAIWSLRDLGIGNVLLNQSDGYLLDPKVSLKVEQGA